jgi:lipopolysaccharide/colanic/teichoic acid biosynthesis glycosyltransferase
MDQVSKSALFELDTRTPASGSDAQTVDAAARNGAPRPVRGSPIEDAGVLRLVKRQLDVVVSVVGLTVLSPAILAVAIAITLDSPGPVLFRQTRIGKHGRPFTMFKFRTMIPDRRKQPNGRRLDGPDRRRVHKSPFDPRTTRVGSLLRRSCFDEVPQLWNVLRGEMSLVGPRPELPEIVAGYESWQHQRHMVLPGITGWWQVNRDGVRLMHESTEMDLYYIQHWTLWLDLRILARTCVVLLRGIGAF